ncbi:MAG TPA: hypothetical protein VHL31_25670 [Geminicoccus sp.]|nr:hypothetical protein [Geminicoccus sp.]HEX2529666.1 hypothetical protein [Geminicoccus sp.]
MDRAVAQELGQFMCMPVTHAHMAHGAEHQARGQPAGRVIQRAYAQGESRHPCSHGPGGEDAGAPVRHLDQAVVVLEQPAAAHQDQVGLAEGNQLPRPSARAGGDGADAKRPLDLGGMARDNGDLGGRGKSPDEGAGGGADRLIADIAVGVADQDEDADGPALIGSAWRRSGRNRPRLDVGI